MNNSAKKYNVQTIVFGSSDLADFSSCPVIFVISIVLYIDKKKCLFSTSFKPLEYKGQNYRLSHEVYFGILMIVTYQQSLSITYHKTYCHKMHYNILKGNNLLK